MKNRFIMLVGLPGAGKSSWAMNYIKEHNGESVHWLSSDMIREELTGNVENQDINKEVFDTLHGRVHNLLSSSRCVTVIYDATNIDRKRRMHFVDELTAKYKDTVTLECVVIAVPFALCLERNRKRTRNVPESVIYTMLRNFNSPWYDEGWNEIHIDYNYKRERWDDTPATFIDQLDAYQQDNPHHAETLGQHMREAAQYMLHEYEYAPHSLVYIAALIHDCGKPFCAIKREKNGKSFTQYIGHENASAYLALMFDYSQALAPYCNDQDSVLQIAYLVGMHMRPFQWEGGMKQTKVNTEKMIIGKLMVETIEKLHKADIAASHEVGV